MAIRSLWRLMPLSSFGRIKCSGGSLMSEKKDQDPLRIAENDKSAFERVQLARHGDRPHTIDFISRLFKDFVELHGDRRFADDPAVICGLATFHEVPVVVVGHQKGRDTKQRPFRNFGMPKPEGY